MKKLAIFAHHDPKGAVRAYIVNCLNGLRETVDDILVVINGELSQEGRATLQGLGVECIVRANEGFDFWAWKAGLDFLGMDKVREYREVLLTNCSFYGPLHSFLPMWQHMDGVACDWWGITEHPALPELHIPPHLQSYWLVLRKPVLASEAFALFWNTLPAMHTYADAVRHGELGLSTHLSHAGFTQAAFIPAEVTSPWRADPCLKTDTLVLEHGCPVVKRKYFTTFKKELCKVLDDCGTRLLFDHIQETAPSALDAIWEDLLATEHMSVINDSLHLNYIIGTHERGNTALQDSDKTALILYAYYDDLVEYAAGYVQNLPARVEVFIVTVTEEAAKKFSERLCQVPNRVHTRTQPNRGRDTAALLVTCADVIQNHDLVCFVHLKKTPHAASPLVGESFREHCFSCLLFNQPHVLRILELFQKNPRLGLLAPFPPTAFGLDFVIGSEWRLNYAAAASFLHDRLGLAQEPDPYVPAPFGGMFWARTAALRTLTAQNWSYEDFPAEPFPANDGLLPHVIERVLPSLAQHDGFYTAWVLPDCRAGSMLNNLHYLLRKERVGHRPKWRKLRLTYLRYLLLGKLLPGKYGKRYSQKLRKAKDRMLVARAAEMSSRDGTPFFRRERGAK